MSRIAGYDTIKTDVLVIGAGGSGLRAAIEAVKNGASVMILCKEVLGCAHTGMAMGGLNAALEGVDSCATPTTHYQDTFEGGWRIGDRRLIRIFANEIPQRIAELEEYGVIFDREPNGRIYTWLGGKQSHPLNICIGDYSGRELMQALVDQTRKHSIPYLEEHFVCKIFKSKNHVIGCLAIDLRSGRLKIIRSKAIILASGGGGRMYEVSTNAASNTADGYAMALDLGCELVDMEMIQFHPTGMITPPSVKGVLVTEKVRGHGGRLLNMKKERFMKKYYPKKMELAGRDEVSRSIYQEVKMGHGTKSGGVYLDVTHLDRKEIEEKIPRVLEQFLITGVDIRKEPMEVYPTMHHFCGGVRINEWAETSVENLFACCEVAGGIHGANRLGGNALAEGQVFGRRAGLAASRIARSFKQITPVPQGEIKLVINKIESYLDGGNGVRPHELEGELRKIMWNKVGIIRSERSLSEASRKISQLAVACKKQKTVIKSIRRNCELMACYENVNMMNTAQTIIAGARRRKESRGGHFRSDYPEMSKAWERNILVRKRNDKLELEMK